MEDKNVIQVRDLTKIYKLYDKPSDRLKEALGLTRRKRFKEHYALRGLNFRIREGECVGIIGVNGSGKSTLLKIITGVLTPTSGEVSVEGRISALLELGAGFNMEYTGIENVYLNGTMMGFSKEEIDRRLPDILSFADIGDYVNQPVKTYSSGMFVRLAFAVAINIDPEILIVDEALSVGDVFFQAKCFHKFEEFKKQGKTVLIVSHDLGSITRYCDRVLLLHQGNLLDQGSPKEMVDVYKQLLVHQEPVRQAEGQEGEGSGTWERWHDGISGATTIPKGEDDPSDVWQQPFQMNPDILEYGERRAEITGIRIVDDRGRASNVVHKGKPFAIKVRVLFYEPIQDPIVAYTFLNVHGTEIAGTNTMYEKMSFEDPSAGRECEVTFRQQMDLQGGEYLLSFGCTGFRDGDFTVYHRLYYACNVTVVSDKNTVGFFDMNSRVEIQELNGR